MEIDLRTLEQGQTHLELELAPSTLAISPQDVRIEGPLRVALELDRRGDEIWVRGHLHALTPQQCSRCLTDFSQILELDFEVFCAKVQNPHVEGHPALSEEDGGVHPHDGRVLSLDGEIREAVILGLPMRPLCKESCAGLCPRCGEDRNLGPCRCERAAAPAET